MTRSDRQKIKHHHKAQFKKTQIILMICMFFVTIIVGYFSYLVAFWQLPLGRVILVSMIVFLSVILFVKYYINWRKITVLLQVVYCILAGFVLVKGGSMYQMTKTLNGNFAQVQYKLKVLTLNSSSIFTLPQINTAILAPSQVDDMYIPQLIKDIGSNTNAAVTLKETNSYMSAYQALLAKEVPAIIMNSAEEPVIYRQYPNYYQSVKSIYEYTNHAKETIQLPQGDGMIGNTLFGIMTASGDIKADSTLTSATLYMENGKENGVKKQTVDLTTLQTLERNGQSVQITLGELGLFGKEKLVNGINTQENVTINHMVVVDYTKLLNLIDVFGTVVINNDTEFYSRENNITFSKGQLVLSKEQARLFTTDTQDGFSHRQQLVVSALLRQVGLRVDALTQSNVLTILSSSIKTDMSFKQFSQLLVTFD